MTAFALWPIMQESMQEADSIHDLPTTDQAVPPPSSRRRGIVGLLILFLALLLLTVLPPLINVSRFQLRIARNIGAAIGRPVHFDHVSLVLLPLPGFTLDNFTVEEDPAFGAEPILRAGQVRVTLRFSSLWRKRVEFATIALTEPSVNLVHAANGKWNIEGLLFQATRIDAAPTAQRFAGPARRFPYIEATGGRLNFKRDQEKTPFSLTDADFALWLPEPHQWRLRVEAHPIRTDTTPGDNGILRVEGTLGAAGVRAGSLAQTPIDLHGDWQGGQLGGLGQLLLGRDSGLRGDVSLSFAILGTVGHNALVTEIKLAKARRADFVPASMLALDARCNAVALNSFHTFASIECHWPPAGSSDPSLLILTADLPDIRQLRAATASVTLPALPAATFLDWLSVATPHPPTGLAGAGTLAGTLKWATPASATPTRRLPARPHPLAPAQPANPVLSGAIEYSSESLDLPALGPQPIPLGDLLLRSTPQSEPPSPRSSREKPAAPTTPGSFDLEPISLPLGGKQPAVLEGHFDAAGYTLHLTGAAIPARLLALGAAIPQLGDGLAQILEPAPPTEPVQTPHRPIDSSTPAPAASPAPDVPAPDPTPIHIDLTATRAWGGPQTWRETTLPPPHHPTRK